MKQLLILAFALGMAQTVNAQSSTATVTQTGADEVVQLEQTDGSAATINQSGSYNWVKGRPLTQGLPPGPQRFGQSNSVLDVTQSGQSNAVVGQQTTVGAVRSTAEIDQTGTFQTADIDQRGGDANEIRITQVGNSAEMPLEERQFARVRQDGSLNEADISQGDPLGDASNFADVRQTGTSNETRIEQDGDDNTADVTQNGTGNEAVVDQDVTLANPSNPQEAIIDQDGINNYAYVEQLGEGNWGRVRQDGNRNQAFRESTDISGIRQTGRGNEADILQRGDDNVARFNTSGSYNDFVITQAGTGGGDAFRNDAGITLNGSTGNAGQLVQSGNDNRAGMTFSQGADYNVDLSLRQSGNSNYASTFFTHVPGGQTEGTILDVVQSGDGNRIGVAGSGGGAGILVTGGIGNEILVDQSGDNNVIGVGGISVQGDSNLIDVTQASNGNTATAHVNGQNNQAIIIQQ